jgi:anaerobic selenocysteine-containing dehydrogenase
MTLARERSDETVVAHPNVVLKSPNGGEISRGESGVEVRKTICDICNPLSNCGIDAHVKDGVLVKIEGTRENPHNAGSLCAKGSASRQYVYHRDRLLKPLLREGDRGSGDFRSVSWDDALDRLAGRLRAIREESGPESVAFYVGYPKWMRAFVKRLAHSFGSPNYLTESSTCAEAAKMGAALNAGAFGLPELDKTRCLMVWSKNPFYTLTSDVRHLVAAKERGVKIIEVGPLLTPLSGMADIHLRIRPGTSGALAHGMARVIIEEGLFDREFVDTWTLGFQEYRDYVRGFTPERVEEITGVPARLMIEASRLYATIKPAGLLTSASPTVHHTNGVQNHRALTALVGLTGNFDTEGGNYVVPPSYLNIPNGAVTRQAEFEQPRAWSDMAPRIGQDRYPVWCRMVEQAQAMHLPFQIRSGQPYPIRALVAFGLNYRMWPGSDFMRESLLKLDLLVDVDLFMTDSARISDLVLPACTTFERSELKFYQNGYAIWTQPAISPLGESRSDVEIILELARRLTPEDPLLTKTHEACLDWILEPTRMTIADFAKHPAGCFIKDLKRPPYQKYRKSGFKTPSGKFEFTSSILKDAGLNPLPAYEEPGLSPVSTPEMAGRFPLILTTGARPVVPPVPGLQNPERALTLRTAKQTRRLQHAVVAAKKVVVLGASLIGVKVVEILRQRNVEVVLMDVASQMLPHGAHPKAADELAGYFREKGVDVRLGCSIQGMEGDPGGVSCFLPDNKLERADWVAVCTGIRPNLDFIDRSHVAVDQAILVNGRMESSAADLYAAGDVSQGVNLLTGKNEWLGLWANACYQGRTAGLNMADQRTEYPGSIPQHVSPLFDLTFAQIGDLGRQGSNVRVVSGGNLRQGRFCLMVFDGDVLAGVNLLNADRWAGRLREAILRRLPWGRHMPVDGCITLDEIERSLNSLDHVGRMV